MARERPPSRPHSTPRPPSSLDSIVVASGAGFRKLAGCPGYIAPLAAALKPTVRSDSAPAIVIGHPLVAVRPGSLRRELRRQFNHAVHAGGCRRHHRLGHRRCTNRSPAASASARITEMTSGCRRVARDVRLLLRGSASRRCIQRSLFILSFCRRGCDEGVNSAQDRRPAFGANRKTFAHFGTYQF